MTEKEAKDELKQLLTAHIGFSVVGMLCLVVHLIHNL